MMDNQFNIEQEIAVKQKEKIPSPVSSLQSPAPGILIVEDNADLREYLRFLLSSYHVLTAENGQVALEVLQSHRPQSTVGPNKAGLVTEGMKTARLPAVDLIISDLMMPIMDGFQLLKKIKSDDRWWHIPVIMLTARVNVHAKLKALRIGVDDYLTKPFQEEELNARIRNLLHNYSRRQSVYFRREKKKKVDAQPAMDAADREWLETLEQFYLQHMDDSRLSVGFAAQEMLLSERQFHRQLKKLTGLTPNQYLQEIRLNQARQFMESGKYPTVKEACYAVGFSDVQYFTKIFRQRFGSNPSDLLY